MINTNKAYNHLNKCSEQLWFQVSPAEVETILLLHPSVLEAGVVGRRVSDYVDEPVAFVVKEPGAEITEQDLIDYMEKEVNLTYL